MILNHVGRFGSPEVIHTDQGPAFHNELVTELIRLCGIEQYFATAYILNHVGRFGSPEVIHTVALTEVHDELCLS